MPASAPAPAADAKALVTLEQLKPPVAAPVNQPTSAPAPNVQAMIDQAEQKLAARQFSLAESTLVRAVGFEPSSARIRKDLGQAYIGLTNYGKAIENLSRSAELAPNDLETQVLLGKLLAGQGNAAGAVLAFRTALKTSKAGPSEPLAAEALLQLGKALQQQGYLTAADQCYQQLSQWIDSNGDAYVDSPLLGPLVLKPESLLVRRGEMLVQLSRAAEAIKLLQRAYDVDRADPATAQLLVRAYAMDKRFDLAQKTLLQMASQPAQEAQVAALAEQLARIAGNKNLPLQIFDTSGRKDISLGLTMAQVSWQLGAAAESQQILKSILQATPSHIQAGQMLAQVYAGSGQWQQAFEQIAAMVAMYAGPSAADKGSSSALAQLDRLVGQFARQAPAQAAADFAAKIDAASPDAFAMHHVAAELAAARGELTPAAQQYLAALAARNEMPAAYDGLLDVLLLQQRRAAGPQQAQDAQKQIDELMARAGKLDENKFDYFQSYLKGKLAFGQGDLDSALRFLQQARQQASIRKVSYLPTLDVISQVQLAMNRPNDAARTLTEAIVEDRGNEALYRRLVGLLITTGQYADAQRVITQFEQAQGGSVAGKVMQARLHLARGQSADAARVVADLLKQAPGNPDVLLLDFRIAFPNVSGLTGDKQKQAVDKIVAVIKAGPDSDEAVAILQQLLSGSSNSAQALEVYGKLYKDLHHPAAIGRLYAQALVAGQKNEEAAAVLKEALQNNPKAKALRVALLQTLQKLKRTDEAVKLAEQYQSDSDDLESRNFYRALLLEAYTQANQYDKAQRLLDTWIPLTVDRSQLDALRSQKIDLYIKAKQYDQAVQYSQRWYREYERQGEGRDPRVLLLALLSRAKQYDVVMVQLEQWIKAKEDEESHDESPDDEEPVAPLGFRSMAISFLIEAGKMPRAMELADEWLRQSPNTLAPRQAIVAGLMSAQKYDEAVRMIEGWLAGMSTQQEADLKLGAASAPTATRAAVTTRAGEKTEVEQKVVDWCRTALASVLLAQQKHADCVKRIDDFMPTYEKLAAAGYAGASKVMVSLLMTKATCLEELGQPDKAMEMLEKALAANPDDAMLNNNLGYTYADRGIELAKAERMIRKAIALDKTPAVLDSLGWLFYKQGKFVEARRMFEQAIEALEESPEGVDAVILDHTGDTAWRQGDHDAAGKFWKQALEKAKAEKVKNRDTRRVMKEVPAKIDASQKNAKPPVAPLGKDVKEE